MTSDRETSALVGALKQALAEPGEEVTVELGAQKKTAVAGKDGKWLVRLEPLKAGGPFTLKVAGKNTLLVQDVLVVLVKKLPEFQYQPGKSFRGWMRTILINKWRDRPQRNTPAQFESGIDPAASDLGLDEIEKPGRLCDTSTPQLQQVLGTRPHIPLHPFAAYWDSIADLGLMRRRPWTTRQ